MPTILSLVIPRAEEVVVAFESLPQKVKAVDYQPITDSENIEKFINDYFADIPILTKIAECESRYRHLNSKGEILRGEKNHHDRGVMQINLFYHAKTAENMGLDISSLDDNVAYARYLYEKQGAKPWISSSACWAKFNQSEIARR